MKSLEILLVGHAPVDFGVKEGTASGRTRNPVSCQLRMEGGGGGGGGLDAAKPAVRSRALAPSRAPLAKC